VASRPASKAAPRAARGWAAYRAVNPEGGREGGAKGGVAAPMPKNWGITLDLHELRLRQPLLS